MRHKTLISLQGALLRAAELANTLEEVPGGNGNVTEALADDIRGYIDNAKESLDKFERVLGILGYTEVEED